MTDSVPPADRGAARRAAAWRHHPDRGGSAPALIAALQAIDQHVDDGSPVLIVRVSRRSRWRRRLHQWRRRGRARRYITL